MSNLRSDCCRLAALAVCCSIATAAEIHPRVRADASANGSVDALIVFADQARPALPLAAAGEYRARRNALVAALQSRAEHAQRATRAWLDAHGIVHRDFWVANLIEAQVPAGLLDRLAARGDIVRIEPNPSIPLQLPQPGFAAPATGGIAWGVAKIDAPLVWAAGFTGQGVVIGGEDTGYQWNHPALKSHYRGWNGTSANHSYSWHDAIHDSVGNPCGNNAPAPCDDDSHGTHTVGTMVGDDGAGQQIGVAPGAKWIGCRNMDRGAGTPARYIECMQWMLAPTDSNGANPNPDLAPDIISNSWGCPASEGCTVGDELKTAVDTLVDAGILYVVAAGNYYDCETIQDPPAIYDASFVVGATDNSDALAGFSSRGPVGGSTLIRPDLVAPGDVIYSSIPTNAYGTKNGTSMAVPHVAGAAALLMSAFPALKGKPHDVAQILRATAVIQGVHNTFGVTQSCGGVPISTWPNYIAGYGRLDVWNAYRDIIFIDGLDN